MEFFRNLLGYRSYNDSLFQYEEHIRNRIRKFEPVWRIYGEDKAYNLQKLCKDLDLLMSFVLFVGKYPDFRPLRIFEKIEISRGPGSLSENIVQRRNLISSWVYEDRYNYKKEDLDEIDRMIEEAQDEWVTIVFQKVFAVALQEVKDIIGMLCWSAISQDEKDIRNSLKEVGLANPLPIRQIPREALILSSQYFRHLDNPPWLGPEEISS